MKTILKIIITITISFSVIFPEEAKLSTNSIKIDHKDIKKSNISLSIEADEDIYGIQFDIKYNPLQVILSEEAIVSKIPSVNIYNRIKEGGIARVLMFGLASEKILDITTDRIVDFIDIQFKPMDKFRGISVVELLYITLAGKAGTEIKLNSSSPQVFEVSFVVPHTTSLSKNYPNPFNPITFIDYEISESSIVSLVIYDLKGALVKTLVDEFQEGNFYNIKWDGLNENNQSVASGRYILKMSTPVFSDSITMTLLK